MGRYWTLVQCSARAARVSLAATTSSQDRLSASSPCVHLLSFNSYVESPMLKIFEQIFRSETKSVKDYPDELINRATERALDATDPRVRILSAYARKMRPAVIHAIDHVVHLVDAIAAPVPMSRREWGTQAVMGAMFASGDSLQTTIARDPACRDFGATNPHVANPVSALLLAQLSRKQTYGHDLVNDKPVSDVPLTVVSFDHHRLLGLATDEAETRRLLKLRAFDYLLVLALKKITETQDRRQDLVVRRKLLRTKLDIIGRSSGSLLAEPRAADKESLQEKMNQVEAELDDLGTDATVLQHHLEIIIDTLATADRQLWLESENIYIDNMHYLRAVDHPKATLLPLQMLHDANARAMTVQLVVMSPEVLAGGLPPR